MGIISLPQVRDYWSSDPILKHKWFSTIMSRNRFLEFLRYFHIVNNTTASSRSDPNYNRLWKIQPIISVLQETCRDLYSPHEQLSIDESMIGTKCRLSFIQYIKTKPVKWGIKVWICCDSKNGYICAFEVYTGKDPVKPLHVNGLAHGVGVSLLDKFLERAILCILIIFIQALFFVKTSFKRVSILVELFVSTKNNFLRLCLINPVS